MYFWQKNEGVILEDGNFVGPKSSLHLCPTLSRRMVLVSVFSSAKNQLQIEKKVGKLSIFFIPLFAQKNQSEKNLTSFLA